MTIAIIGAGLVGRSTAEKLSCSVDFHDPAVGFVIEDFSKYQLVFVCVDTLQSGPLDYEDINAALFNLNASGYKGIVIIRSTISPKYAKWIDDSYEFSVVLFPEFLPQVEGEISREDSWMVVLGGDLESSTAVGIFLYDANYYSDMSVLRYVSLTDAALIKLTSNSILATKVAMFNAIKLLCDSEGGDYLALKDALLLDSRLGADSHSTVPSPHDGRYGFGGHCLPKDLKAIIELDSYGFFKAVEDTNKALGR